VWGETENRERGERVEGRGFHSASAPRHRPPPMPPLPSTSLSLSLRALSRCSGQGGKGLGFWVMGRDEEEGGIGDEVR